MNKHRLHRRHSYRKAGSTGGGRRVGGLSCLSARRRFARADYVIDGGPMPTV